MDFCPVYTVRESDSDDYNTFDRKLPEDNGVVPHTLIQRITEPVWGTLQERAYGFYNLAPSRVVSSQTRLKNMAYEYPAYGWTVNPEAPPWTPSVPAHGKFIVLNSTTNYSAQESFLQPTGALQMQSEQSWINKIISFFGAQGQQNQSPQPKGLGPIYFNSYGFGGGDNG